MKKDWFYICLSKQRAASGTLSLLAKSLGVSDSLVDKWLSRAARPRRLAEGMLIIRTIHDGLLQAEECEQALAYLRKKHVLS
jgi:hypothetical protein